MAFKGYIFYDTYMAIMYGVAVAECCFFGLLYIVMWGLYVDPSCNNRNSGLDHYISLFDCRTLLRKGDGVKESWCQT